MTQTTTSSEPTDAGAKPADTETLAKHPDAGYAAGGITGGSNARWWMGVAVGLVVSLPLTWLLSYAATLVFMLGLFFFVLFGLVIGAATHRVAAPGRPYGRLVLRLGTAVIVVFVWGLASVKESRDFPHDMAKVALTPLQKIGDRTPAEYRADVADQVRAYLETRHPPGGTLGYVAWMATSGRIAKGELPAVSRTLRRGQARVWYVVRVILSLVFLGFGVSSQTLSLRLTKDSTYRAIDETDDDPTLR